MQNDCGLEIAESPALRGFVGGLRALATAALYLVLKSNGLPRPKIRLKKFDFSSKTVPANIAKKLPSQRCSQPLFNFAHKWPTFAFAGKSGYTPGPAQRIAHNGTHAETGAVSDGGGITTLGVLRVLSKRWAAACQKGAFAVLNPGHAGFPKRVERSEGSDTTPTQNATCFAV